jgi:hypothetical protein
MTEDRRGAAWLEAELSRREDAEDRMAASLLELDRHPGHQLLSGCTPTGTTGARWGAAQQALAGLWRDFAAHRATVRAARDVRGRRVRPGERELADLHRLLVEPAIEIDRTAVALAERGLTGAPERVESIALDALGARMERAFGEVVAVVADADAARTAFLAALVPVLEHLADARRLAAGLGLAAGDAEAGELAALTDRAAELARAAATDPLSCTGAPATDAVAAVRAGAAALSARLAGYGAQRDRWDADRAGLRRDVEALARLRTETERTRARAADLIAAALPPLPPDELPGIREALATLDTTTAWAGRASGLAEARRTLDTATDRLRTAHELAAGLLERRAELRGRFGAFRARATRLGRAEQRQVLALDAEIERLLWTRPCDLAAATRALASYRQHLAGPDTGRSA